MEFTRTEKGGRKLLFEGFAYVLQKPLAGGKQSWECELRRKRECKAKLHLQGERVVARVNEHTHAANVARCEVLTVRDNMKHRAETTEENPQQIIAQATANMSEAAAAVLPKITDVRRGIRRNRMVAGNQLPIPESAATVEIPRPYQLTTNNEQFLQYDSGVGDPQRIIIFASEGGVNLIQNCPHWAADGTFKTVPTIFFQLYTVHCFAGNGQSFPCVYVLLTNKREETYARVMRQLAAMGGNPTDLLVDYERAAMNAFMDVFPDADVKGCFFHLAQNVYRQVSNHFLYKKHCALVMSIVPLFPNRRKMLGK
jgi:hypothetical protein